MVTGTIWKHIGIFRVFRKNTKLKSLEKSAKIPAKTINNHKESFSRNHLSDSGFWQLATISSWIWSLIEFIMFAWPPMFRMLLYMKLTSFPFISQPPPQRAHDYHWRKLALLHQPPRALTNELFRTSKRMKSWWNRIVVVTRCFGVQHNNVEIWNHDSNNCGELWIYIVCSMYSLLL